MSAHLDLDGLADVLAGNRDPDPADLAAETGPSHLAGCDTCRAALSELDAAVGRVTNALLALPEPTLPDGLAARLDAAVAGERRPLTAGSAATVTPLASRRRDLTRWLPVAGGVAAAVALVLGGAFLVNGRGDGSKSASTTSRSADAGIARSSTGTAYAKDGRALASELPALLRGNAPAAGGRTDSGGTPQEQAATPSTTTDRKAAPLAGGGRDPLVALRQTAGLAACLSALSDPSEPGVPLALDYASFEGQPALVVVLPAAKADKVDVFVVGAGCSASDAKLLFFTRLARPS